MILALGICLVTLESWLAVGHFYFQRPRHELRGHEITVYGCAGILVALATYVGAYLLQAIGTTVPVEQVFAITALLFFVGGITTALMHGHDAALELQRQQREAERARYDELQREAERARYDELQHQNVALQATIDALEASK